MELTVVPDVELCQTGTWHASTGEHTFTTDDWEAVVEAANDPAFRAPQVYIGHDHAAWGDGEPSVGHIANLRVSDDGVSLRGDLHLLPAVAELAPVVWPSRSIEGQFSVTSSTGNRYRMILTGLALLGANLPAVETLDDLTALTVAAGSGDTPDRFTLTLGGPHMPTAPAQPVAAAANVEDIRRAWWDHKADELPDLFRHAWARAIYAGDAQYLIVETDEADETTGVYLWQVPWSEADGVVSFGEPVPVRELYAPAEDLPDVAASAEAVCLARFTPDAEAGPLRGVAASALSQGDGTTTTTEVTNMSDTVPASPADDTSADVAAAAAPSVVTVDANVLAELRAGAEAGRTAAVELAAIRHASILDAAVAAGRISPASRDQFAALLASDEAGTVALIETLAPVAPTVELGAATDPSTASDDALYAELFGTTEA